MLRAEIIILMSFGFFSGQDDDLSSPICESLEHASPPDLVCGSGLGAPCGAMDHHPPSTNPRSCLLISALIVAFGQYIGKPLAILPWPEIKEASGFVPHRRSFWRTFEY